jgi:GcrA cell cycle regulator
MRADDASADKTPTDKTPTDKTPTDKTWINKTRINKTPIDKAWADRTWTDKTWTDERIAILKQMWAEGATAVAIADRLGGLSRSAVLGKIFRLRPGVAREKPVAAKALPKPAALKRRRPAPRVAPQPLPQRAPKPLRQRGKSLLELTNDTCRWPHGEPGTRGFFFCGAPGADLEGGKPYCVCHARRAYGSAENAAAHDDSFIVAVRNSPSIAPLDAPRRYVWRAPVKHPAPRWK